MAKRKSRKIIINAPKYYNPGKGRPREELAYISPREKSRLLGSTDHKSEMTEHGILSFADDSASSTGMSRGDPSQNTVGSDQRSSAGSESSTRSASERTSGTGTRGPGTNSAASRTGGDQPAGASSVGGVSGNRPGGANTSSGSGSARSNNAATGDRNYGGGPSTSNNAGNNMGTRGGVQANAGSNNAGQNMGTRGGVQANAGSNNAGQQASANAATGAQNYGSTSSPSSSPVSDRGPLGPQGQRTGFPGGGVGDLASLGGRSLLGGKPKDQSRIGDEPANTNMSPVKGDMPMAPPGRPPDNIPGPYGYGLPKADRLAYDARLRERIPGEPHWAPQEEPNPGAREPDFTNPGVNETVIGKQYQVTDAPVPMNRTPQAIPGADNVSKLDYMDSEFGIGSMYDPTSVFEGVPKDQRYGSPVMPEPGGYPGRGITNPMNEGATSPEESPWDGFSAPVTEPGAPISPEEINDRRHMGPGLADTTISPAQAKQVAVAEPPSVKDRLEYGLLQSDTALNNRMRAAVNDTMDVPRTVSGNPRQDQLTEQAQMDRAFNPEAPPGLPGRQNPLAGYPGRGQTVPTTSSLPTSMQRNPYENVPIRDPRREQVAEQGLLGRPRTARQDQLAGYPGRGAVNPPNISDMPQVVNAAPKRDLLGSIAATSPPWEGQNWPHPNLPGPISAADVPGPRFNVATSQPPGFDPLSGIATPPRPAANSSIPTAAENQPTYDPLRDPRANWSAPPRLANSSIPTTEETVRANLDAQLKTQQRLHARKDQSRVPTSGYFGDLNIPPRAPPGKPIDITQYDKWPKDLPPSDGMPHTTWRDRLQPDDPRVADIPRPREKPEVPDNSREIEAEVEARVREVKTRVPTENVPEDTVREIVKRHGEDADWISRVLNTFKSFRAAKVHGGEGGKGKSGKRAGLYTAPRLRPNNTNVIPPDAPLLA